MLILKALQKENYSQSNFA